jgi:hypothetical protein
MPVDRWNLFVHAFSIHSLSKTIKIFPVPEGPISTSNAVYANHMMLRAFGISRTLWLLTNKRKRWMRFQKSRYI